MMCDGAVGVSLTWLGRGQVMELRLMFIVLAMVPLLLAIVLFFINRFSGLAAAAAGGSTSDDDEVRVFVWGGGGRRVQVVTVTRPQRNRPSCRRIVCLSSRGVRPDWPEVRWCPLCVPGGGGGGAAGARHVGRDEPDDLLVRRGHLRLQLHHELLGEQARERLLPRTWGGG
jgi:hypothetical protein